MVYCKTKICHKKMFSLASFSIITIELANCLPKFVFFKKLYLCSLTKTNNT